MSTKSTRRRLSENPLIPNIRAFARYPVEIGDVLWALAACCTELDVSLDDVAKINLDKVRGRVERGTITGDGDDR